MNEILKSNICSELGKNFINYATAVNGDRAIPDSRTGLKPVAQRILFIMEDEGVKSTKPHKKCAKVVGSVMGRVHPHGDSSIYEAMVRLAQPWTMRYPLIDWHGNLGSQGGDGAAAMRYTESRLAKISEDGLLAGLKKKTVDFKPTFDETEEEPVTLPALFPNLLCNPNMGIGVAMACNWLPHNLTDMGNTIIEYLVTGNLNFDNLAPDFPTGGTIINGKDLKLIYSTGKGKATIRGNYVSETRGGKDLIVFTEIPYGVNTEALLDEINEACTKELITGVEEVRDESNKKGLRLVFELSKGASEGSVLKQLFKETNLQKSVSANQVALVDKTPTLLNLKQCIDIYVKHNIDVITRETEFDLSKAKARLEIVDGLLRALEDIDNIIALIKKSKSAAVAKDNLMATYKFTEPQAKAIVDMKLGKLAGLEKIELQNEQAELNKQVSELENILANSDVQKRLLVDRLSAFVKKYGDGRRTQVTHLDIKPEEKEIETVIPEDCVVVVTQTGYIKRVPKQSFRVQKRNGVGAKNPDDALLDMISTNTVDTLMLFTSQGKMYRLIVDNIPSGTNVAKGVHIGTLVNLEAKEEVIAVTSLYRKTDAEYVVFITKNGLVKKTKLEEYTKVKRSTGIAAINIKDGDSIANVTFLKDEDLVLVTKNGMAIHFSTTDIAPIGRVTAGVKGIKLADGDMVLKGLPIHKVTDNLAVFNKVGTGKKMVLADVPEQGRGGKGVKVTTEGNEIVGAEMISKEDNLLIVGNTNSICISAEEIPLLTRGTLGNVMIKNNSIKYVVKL